MNRQRNKAKTPPRCPRCTGPGEIILDGRKPSRKDGTTLVCRNCARAETYRLEHGEDPWPTYPDPVRP